MSRRMLVKSEIHCKRDEVTKQWIDDSYKRHYTTQLDFFLHKKTRNCYLYKMNCSDGEVVPKLAVSVFIP